MVKEQIERPLRTISEEEWNEYLDYKRWKTHKPQRQEQRQHQIIEGYQKVNKEFVKFESDLILSR